jgi:hypothetical protein
MKFQPSLRQCPKLVKGSTRSRKLRVLLWAFFFRSNLVDVLLCFTSEKGRKSTLWIFYKHDTYLRTGKAVFRLQSSANKTAKPAQPIFKFYCFLVE